MSLSATSFGGELWAQIPRQAWAQLVGNDEHTWAHYTSDSQYEYSFYRNFGCKLCVRTEFSRINKPEKTEYFMLPMKGEL